ncbi:hypothetical protein, partial [Vibrio splendidus]|uniref:hypothetical protein n=1 Tax=Vibrio splendidus TaxID=29497 RepID=UPI0019D70B54
RKFKSCKGSHIQESQVERLGFFSFEQKLTLFSIAANSTSSPDHPHKVKASLSYLDSTHP